MCPKYGKNYRSDIILPAVPPDMCYAAIREIRPCAILCGPMNLTGGYIRVMHPLQHKISQVEKNSSHRAKIK